MMQRAATMPVHPNTSPSMPYDMSRYPLPHSEMSGGPQPSSQRGHSWSYLDVNEGEGDSSDFSDGDPEQGPEAQKRSPPSIPFADGRRPKKGSPSGPSGSPAPDQLPCRLCQRLSPRHVIEHWRGFCSESHRTQWMTAHQQW
ncbi:hypothetical protein BGY98DRAFT_120670 [Russula aff. rugulosa BPL654]|nr:hypothetical protein BGY98DRAFT_120670 [Russula aff. rugulosa BPL654]